MGKHWWPWCCCPYCVKRFSKQMKVTITGLEDTPPFCSNCDQFEGVYAPLKWWGLEREWYTFCDGTSAKPYCLWETGVVIENVPCAGPGSQLTNGQVNLYVAEKNGFYHVEVVLEIRWQVTPHSGHTFLKWQNRYSSKPDCENFDDEIMGTHDTCIVQGTFAICEYSDYTSVLLTALETCK